MSNIQENNKVLNLYPIDYPFETLVDRVEKGKLILNPHFQRQYKWDKDGDERPSKFIESCLMRIPIPSCYFAEMENSNHLVIDGVQRITTIQKFFNDKFALKGLTTFTELEGKRFSELGEYRNELESYTIRCTVLRKDNDKQVITEVFARLNQGSVLLTPQEIRHAIFGNGAFDKLLKELAQHERIKHFKLGKKGRQLKDGLESEEQVLRFFAMKGNLTDYNGNFSQYMDKYMEQQQNINEQQVNTLRDLFQETMNKCLLVFGKNAFMNPGKNKPKESFVNYDLLMWSFQHYSKEFLETHQELIKKKFEELCNLPEFTRLASGGGLQRKQSILKRRSLWEAKLREIDDKL